MGNSPLINSTYLVSHCTTPRQDKIRKVTIHHMAGVMDARNCAMYHERVGGVSANYYIGNDGQICLGVPESSRAWTSGSRENDNQAITIEVSNCETKEPWRVSDAAYQSLLALCVDICRRNDIKPTWTGDKSGTFTCHYMFDATGCPGTFLTRKMPRIVEAVREALEAGAKPTLTNYEQIYTVQTGDTWEKIGVRYGIAAAHLLEYNNYKTADANAAKKSVTQKTIRIPAKFIKGDVDGDGRVSAADARKILRASAKLGNLTPAERMRADVNADGKVTSADARAALRTSAKL